MSIDRRKFLGFAAAGVGASKLAIASGRGTSTRRALGDAAQFGPKQVAVGRKGMAITSHPLATYEAVRVLRDGGNAADAALCACITQSVVEPHMTTITGTLSMLHYDADLKETTYVCGSPNAPRQRLDNFTSADLLNGRGVVVPGWWAGFEAAHRRHGTLQRKRIMAPAIELARHGFEIHPFLWGEMFSQLDSIGATPAGREIYMPGNVLLRPGDILRQTRAADTLERLAEEGSAYFYQGEFARELVNVVRKAGGVLTREDLADYRARWQAPARGTYRGHDIVASSPPDHGGSHLIEILNMVELLDLRRLGPPTQSAETLLQMIRIVQEVFTAGAQQRDPAYHHVPLDILLSKDYAAMRLELLRMQYGDPPRAPAAPPPPGSNHVTVCDARGNIATILHSSLSLPWSNGLFVAGISIAAAAAHYFRVQPGPGERLSVYPSPNILFKDGRPVLASGSPSVALLATIVQNTTSVLDFGLPIEEAVMLPRFGASSMRAPGAVVIEADFDQTVRELVRERGQPLDIVSPWNYANGSFDGIQFAADGSARACADPRRTGMALAA